MKKFVTMLLVLSLLCMTFAGCGKKEQEPPKAYDASVENPKQNEVAQSVQEESSDKVVSNVEESFDFTVESVKELFEGMQDKIQFDYTYANEDGHPLYQMTIAKVGDDVRMFIDVENAVTMDMYTVGEDSYLYYWMSEPDEDGQLVDVKKYLKLEKKEVAEGEEVEEEEFSTSSFAPEATFGEVLDVYNIEDWRASVKVKDTDSEDELEYTIEVDKATKKISRMTTTDTLGVAQSVDIKYINSISVLQELLDTEETISAEDAGMTVFGIMMYTAIGGNSPRSIEGEEDNN